jgi:flagellar basal body rod protein FlgC
MNSAMNIAVSGMRAASTGFAASASHLVNLESDGPAPATSPQQQVASAPGRVAPFASMQGVMVQSDAAQDVANMMTASLAYRANIASFKTAQQMEKTLLDATA